MPALRKLKAADPRGPVFFFAALERLGKGGDDHAILTLLEGHHIDGSDPAVLDAWLRLHEQGFEVRFPVPLASLLADAGPALYGQRPDLLKRATAAAAELGLEWPPPSWTRSPSAGPR